MTDEEMRELVKLRLESSRELYNDACNLYEQGSYKSANNRAYYSMEKALKALLAIKGKDANTHNGILQLFNRYFIYEDNTEFNKADYKLYASIELIRTASDYDDFYIASREKAEEQFQTAKLVIGEVKKYLEE